MFTAMLQRYQDAVDCAFDDVAMCFWGWLEKLKDDTHVGHVRATDGCPLYWYMQDQFCYDNVSFEVTGTQVVVRERDNSEVVLTVVPLPPVARRFILFMDRGGPRGPIDWGEEGREHNPSITAAEALCFLRLACGEDPTEGTTETITAQ